MNKILVLKNTSVQKEGWLMIDQDLDNENSDLVEITDEDIMNENLFNHFATNKSNDFMDGVNACWKYIKSRVN